MKKQLRAVNTEHFPDYRKYVIAEYIITRKGITQSEKANELVEYAYERGWTELKSMTGARMNRFGKTLNVPKWMVKSAFGILLTMNWQPDPDRVWALFIHYWMYEKGPFFSVEAVLESLPPNFDRKKAAEWVNFLDYRLGASNLTQLICHAVNLQNERVSEDHISIQFLMEELSDKYNIRSEDDLDVIGLQIRNRYIYKENIQQERNVPTIQVEKVLKNIDLKGH